MENVIKLRQTKKDRLDDVIKEFSDEIGKCSGIALMWYDRDNNGNISVQVYYDYSEITEFIYMLEILKRRIFSNNLEDEYELDADE